MAGGRPSEYDPKFCDQIIEYFSVKPYEQAEQIERVENERTGEVSINKTLGPAEANDVPTLAGFAAKIGVHRETLLNWCDAHAEFFDAFKRAKDLQENFIVINGNKGLISPSFAIFTAKNVLNWRDKQENVMPAKFAGKTEDELDARIAELEQKLLEGKKAA